MRPSGIVFDVYGTLFDVSAVAAALGEVAEQPDELSRLWRAKQLEYSFVRTLLGDYIDFDRVTEQALDYTLDLHHIHATPEQRSRLLLAWRELPLFPEVRGALDALHEAGIPLAILSNGARQSLSALLERARVAHLFDPVLSSEDVSVYKPHPAIYCLVSEHFDGPLDEIAFVSANGFDIAGARRFGFTVVRVDRTDAPLDPLGVEPHLTVGDFRDLARYVLSDG